MFRRLKKLAGNIITVVINVYMATVDEESRFLCNLEAGLDGRFRSKCQRTYELKPAFPILYPWVCWSRDHCPLCFMTKPWSHVCDSSSPPNAEICARDSRAARITVLPKATPCLWNIGEFYSVRGWNPHGHERFHGKGPVGLALHFYTQLLAKQNNNKLDSHTAHKSLVTSLVNWRKKRGTG